MIFQHFCMFVFFSVLVISSCEFYYSQEILLTNDKETRLNADIKIRVNTKALVEEGVLDEDCSNLSFWEEKSGIEDPMKYWMETSCNLPDTVFWIRKARLDHGDSSISFKFGDIVLENPESYSIQWDGEFLLMRNGDCSQGADSWRTDDQHNGKFLKGSEVYGSWYEREQESHGHALEGYLHSGVYRTSQPTDQNDCKNEVKNAEASSTTSKVGYLAHAHRIEDLNFDPVDVEVPNVEVFVCRSEGGLKEIPNGALLMIETLSDYSSLNNSEWKFADDFVGRFPVISTQYQANLDPVGSSVHLHSATDLQLSPLTHYDQGFYCENDGTGSFISTYDHTHSIPGKTYLDNVNHLPPYENIAFIEATVDFPTLTPGMILGVTKMPPFGWSSVTTLYNSFPRGSVPGDLGKPGGGSASHQHSHSPYLFGAVDDPHRDDFRDQPLEPEPDIKGCSVDHFHTLEGVTVENIDLNIPDYLEVIFIKKSDSNFLYVFQPRHKVESVKEETINGMEVAVGLLVPTFVVLACFIVVVVSFVVFFFLYCRKRTSYDALYAKLVTKGEFELNETQNLYLENFQASGEFNVEDYVQNRLILSMIIKYEDLKIEKYIGAGSTGTVFYGTYEGIEIAFKTFKTRANENDREAYAEFEREMGFFNELKHPNVLKMYGAVLKRGQVGLVFEYCPYGDVKNFLKKNPLYAFWKRVALCEKICDVMRFLHHKNIIHRDLKLENVLIDKNLEPQIMDFGLSRKLQGDVSMTKRVGTALYMAPEMYKSGCSYTNKVDVFSFAMMMYIIFSNNYSPFGFISSRDAMSGKSEEERISRGERPDLQKLMCHQKHDSWIAKLLESCWEQQPEARIGFDVAQKELKSRLGGGKRKERTCSLTISVENEDGELVKEAKVVDTFGDLTFFGLTNLVRDSFDGLLVWEFYLVKPIGKVKIDNVDSFQKFSKKETVLAVVKE